jgi:hypothetical protein
MCSIQIYFLALLFCVNTMICWETNIQKLDGKNRPFQIFYQYKCDK